MNHQQLEALLDFREQDRQATDHCDAEGTGRIGILTADPVGRRLLEGLPVQIDREPEILLPDMLSDASGGVQFLLPFELIVADEDQAVLLHEDLQRLSNRDDDGNIPALVAIRSRHNFDQDGFDPPHRTSRVEFEEALWVTREIVSRHKGRMRVRSCGIPDRSWTVSELVLPYQGLVP